MSIQVKSIISKVGVVAFCIFAISACGGGDGSVSGNLAGSGSGQPVTPTLAALQTLDDGTGVGAVTFAKGATISGGQGQVIQGLSCSKPVKFSTPYGYAHLNMVVDGQLIAIPDGIGFVSQGNTGIVDPALKKIGCYYPLATTDTSGKIRFQPGGATPFTLGQFFALWGQPLTTSNVAGYIGKPIKVFIKDGVTLTEYTGSPDVLPLLPNREITIQIGSALNQIPNFGWTNPPALSATPIALKRGANGPSNGQSGLEDNLFNGKGGQGNAVDGLLCYGPRNQNRLEEIYHVHSHLAIFRDGVQLAIPSFIGIVGNDTIPNTFCIYPLHSHDSTGMIHVEPIDNNPVTLGQFFNIWGQPLTRTNVAGQASTSVVVYIQDGGNIRKYQGDPKNIELKSYRSIVIQLGTALNEIPTYDIVDEIN